MVLVFKWIKRDSPTCQGKWHLHTPKCTSCLTFDWRENSFYNLKKNEKKKKRHLLNLAYSMTNGQTWCMQAWLFRMRPQMVLFGGIHNLYISLHTRNQVFICINLPRWFCWMMRCYVFIVDTTPEGFYPCWNTFFLW